MNTEHNYELIPMSEITPEARRVAVLWCEEFCAGFAIIEKHKLASDIMNYAKQYHEEMELKKISQAEREDRYAETKEVDERDSKKEKL